MDSLASNEYRNRILRSINYFRNNLEKDIECCWEYGKDNSTNNQEMIHAWVKLVCNNNRNSKTTYVNAISVLVEKYKAKANKKWEESDQLYTELIALNTNDAQAYNNYAIPKSGNQLRCLQSSNAFFYFFGPNRTF